MSRDWSGAEIDYDDGYRLGMPGRMDRLFACEGWIAVMVVLMVSGYCIIGPLAGFLGGLGLLVCHTYEARVNAAMLLVAAAGHGVLLWILAVNVYVR